MAALIRSAFVAWSSKQVTDGLNVFIRATDLRCYASDVAMCYCLKRCFDKGAETNTACAFLALFVRSTATWCDGGLAVEG